jgi:nitrate/nitrite transporter NarK
MTKLKFLAAAAALVTFMAGPANARVYHHARHYYHHRYYNPGPIGAAAGIAGAAIGTAGAIATAPVRDSYGYYGYDRGYDPYYGPGPNYGPRW